MSGFVVGSVITNSPINGSSSKQSYSFTKGSRFEKKNNLMQSAGLMYNLPSVKETRATSLGIGNKMSFGGKNRNQPPFYNLPSDFDSKKSSGFSFGISREYYKKVLLYLNAGVCRRLTK